MDSQPGRTHWIYEEPRSRGATVLLLTIGRTTVRGTWTGALGEYYIAWAPNPIRNQEIEDQLVREGRIPQ